MVFSESGDRPGVAFQPLPFAGHVLKESESMKERTKRAENEQKTNRKRTEQAAILSNLSQQISGLTPCLDSLLGSWSTSKRTETQSELDST